MEDEIYKHVCKGCMFSTNSSAKWQRHLTTKKHYAMLKRQQKDFLVRSTNFALTL